MGMTTDSKHFPLINAEKALRAFDAFVLPSVRAAIAGGDVDGCHFHVTVLRPGVPYKEIDESV